MKVEILEAVGVQHQSRIARKAGDFLSEEELTELWSAFWIDRGRETRNHLARGYEHVIGAVISRLNADLRSYWEYGDLYGFGYVGLLEAIERFREDSPVAVFKGYVAQRIRGAIMDELRKLDWLPRSIRERANELRAMTNRMALETGATPTRSTLVDAMGISPGKGDGVFVAMRDVWILSIDQLNTSVGDVIVSRNEGPEAEVLGRMSQEAALEALKKLPSRERDVLSLRYLGGLTQAAIGTMMGLTHSRICQIETSALNRLRTSPSFRNTGDEQVKDSIRPAESVALSLTA